MPHIYLESPANPTNALVDVQAVAAARDVGLSADARPPIAIDNTFLGPLWHHPLRLATVVGAVGGGVAGNGIEHAVRKQTSYQVQVRMQDGSYRNFTYATQPQVQVGQRVHVSGDSLTAS